MKITRETKVQQGKNILTTAIPAIVCEIMNIHKGTVLTWDIENENEVKIRLK